MVQPGDTAGVLALRALPLLLAAAAAAATFPAYAWQAAVVGLCALSPLPDAVRPLLLSKAAHLKSAQTNYANAVGSAGSLQVHLHGALAGCQLVPPLLQDSYRALYLR